jgi:hypothetical protein
MSTREPSSLHGLSRRFTHAEVDASCRSDPIPAPETCTPLIRSGLEMARIHLMPACEMRGIVYADIGQHSTLADRDLGEAAECQSTTESPASTEHTAENHQAIHNNCMRATNRACLVLAAIAASPTLLANPLDYVVAHWQFEESAGAIVDSSGNGYDGVPLGGLTQGVAGYHGSGLQFDGVSGYFYASSAVLNNVPVGTFEAWVKPDPGAPNPGPIVSKGDRMLTDFMMWASSSSTAVTMGQLYTAGSLYWVPAFVIPDGEWTHVAMTWDESSLRLYMNGALRFERSGSATPFVSANVTKIGHHTTTDVRTYFAGIMDDVRISNRALTPSEFLCARVPESLDGLTTALALFGLLVLDSRARRCGKVASSGRG